MKLVLLEKNSVGLDVTFDSFKGLGELVAYENTKPEEIAERVGDADIVIMNKCPMNESTLGGDKNLKFVATLATGFDVIDTEYLKSRGVAAANVKGYSTDSVAQHTIALALNLVEKLPYYTNYVQSGAYTKSSSFSHIDNHFWDLSGKTWGIVGMGNIGRRVAELAKAFGCKVLYYSTTGVRRAEEYDNVTLEELCTQSDVISVHCPLTEKTRHLVNRDFLGRMKKSAFLINVARGPVVDEEAMRWALENGEIAGAGLDVLSKEPMREDNPLYELRNLPNLIITPHMGWGSHEARQRLVEEVALNIRAFLAGEERNLITK